MRVILHYVYHLLSASTAHRLPPTAYRLQSYCLITQTRTSGFTSACRRTGTR